MKPLFISLMSALALIALFSVVAQAWEATTATTWGGSGWVSHYSSSVTSTTETAYLFATAPYSSNNCAYRYAQAIRASDWQALAISRCTDGTVSGTVECCVKTTWYPEIGIGYKAHAWQTRNTASDCGPTHAKITSIDASCSETAPGGQ